MMVFEILYLKKICIYCFKSNQTHSNILLHTKFIWREYQPSNSCYVSIKLILKKCINIYGIPAIFISTKNQKTSAIKKRTLFCITKTFHWPVELRAAHITYSLSILQKKTWCYWCMNQRISKTFIKQRISHENNT